MKRRTNLNTALDEIEVTVNKYRQDVDYYGDITAADEVLKKISEIRQQREFEQAINEYKLGKITKQKCMSKLAKIFQELVDEKGA